MKVSCTYENGAQFLAQQVMYTKTMIEYRKMMERALMENIYIADMEFLMLVRYVG